MVVSLPALVVDSLVDTTSALEWSWIRRSFKFEMLAVTLPIAEISPDVSPLAERKVITSLKTASASTVQTSP
jgi:hypothetical protein